MRFQTAADLRELLGALWPKHDVLIMAAAVADYRAAVPAEPSGKLPRRQRSWKLELEPTPDLLQELAATCRPDQITIGFALDPADRLLASAREKLVAKGVDAIVANRLETIGSDRVGATVLLRDGSTLHPPGHSCSKREFADWLLDQLDTIKARRH